MSDPDALKIARHGEVEAYGEIVRLYHGQVRGFVALLGVAHSHQDELVKDVFIDAWRALPRYDGARPFAPWLNGVARNVVRRHQAHQARECLRAGATACWLRGRTGPTAPDPQAELLVGQLILDSAVAAQLQPESGGEAAARAGDSLMPDSGGMASLLMPDAKHFGIWFVGLFAYGEGEVELAGIACLLTALSRQVRHMARAMLVLAILTGSAPAVDTVTINAGTVLADTSAHPIGINLDYLMDDDSRLGNAPARSTRDALAAMGVKFLRYPGGEKAQNYLWSVSPWSSATPRSALPNVWPATDRTYFSNDGTTPLATTLTFDEFMSMATSIGAEPVIVVNSDSQYVAGGPTQETLLQTAENWVRYANVVKGYGIKYWMIGNETWNANNYAGSTTAANHKADVIAFSQRMKAIDSTIKIVASGNGTNSTWNSTVLSGSNAFDYLTINGYFNPGTSYTNYQNTNNTYQNVTTIINQISTSSQTGDGSRIRACYYEWNGIDWGNSWANTNDMGHALLNFQIQGDMLAIPGWDFSCLWNTRWVGDDPTNINNALKADGSFTAVGQSLAIWGKNLKDKMVSCIASTQVIRPYACTANADGSMNAFFINKDVAAHAVNVTLSSYTAQTKVGCWQMVGTGSSDQAPTWSQKKNLSMSGPSVAVTLPAVSITMLTFTAAAAVAPAITTQPTNATVTPRR